MNQSINQMKNIIFAAVFMSINVAFAQDTDVASKLDSQSKFERPSINYLSASFSNLRSTFDASNIEINAAFDVNEIDRKDITIGNNVFIGSHCVIKGGANIGNYCVVGAGTIVDAIDIPDYSLVVGNPMIVKKGYYKK